MDVDDLLRTITGEFDKNVEIEIRRQSKWGSYIVSVTISRGDTVAQGAGPSLSEALVLAAARAGIGALFVAEEGET